MQKNEILKDYQESETSLKEKMAQEAYEEVLQVLSNMQDTVLALIMHREGFEVFKAPITDIPDTNPADASFNAPDWALRRNKPYLN